MSYHLVKLHPNLVDDRQPHHEGLFRAPEEKQQCVRDFYEKKQHIPLCVDHCNADVTKGGFVVPQKDRIGHVKDLFVDRHGQVIAKLWLDNTHSESRRIMQSMLRDQQPWGASVWIDVARQHRGGPIVSKDLTHVALTTDPYFANHNTFMRDFALEGHEQALDQFVARELWRDGECFTGEAYAAKLKELSSLPQKPMSNPAPTQQPPAEQSQPQQPQSDGDLTQKRQRLDNASDGSAQQRKLLVEPQLVDFDPEDGVAVRDQLIAIEKWIDENNLTYNQVPIPMRRHHSKLVVAQEGHDEKIKESINEAIKHGFKPENLDKIMGTEERGVFYEVMACNRKAMDQLKGQMDELQAENERLKNVQPQYGGGYSQKPTNYSNNVQAPQQSYQAPRGQTVADASISKIFGSNNWREEIKEKHNAYMPAPKAVAQYQTVQGARDHASDFVKRGWSQVK